MNTNALLPNGLFDLLSPEAEKEAAVISGCMKVFSSFGYQRVKPPLVEFEETLLGGGPGSALSSQTFRMMDPVSRRMMGVRADATAQIARIASSRLANETRPLRLSYAADVLRVNGTQLRPERQFCQVGCEMIGADHVRADVELALVALKALVEAGIENLSIDLTLPTLARDVFEELKLAREERERLYALIEKRDRDAVAAVSGEAARTIAALMDAEGSAEKAVPVMAALSVPGKAGAGIKRLLAVAGELKEALAVYGLTNVQITIDPLEWRGFEYQTGVSFTLFSKGARGELGRGGRYDVIAGKEPETATGFTLYMDTVLQVASAPPETRVEEVSAGTDWREIRNLQARGVRICQKF
jgi:ATP phosphoribosyltransferase regulatory subunit